MGSRLLIARVVARLCASYLAILLGVLVVLDVLAYVYLASAQRDVLEPILGTPEGSAAYAHRMQQIALGLVLFDVPVLIVGGKSDIIFYTDNSFYLEQHLPNAQLILYPNATHGFLFQ